MINVDKELIKNTIRTYGIDKQLVVAVEELSELQKEICKHLRGKTDREHIIEETADVLIMIGNIKVIFGIPDEKLSEVIKAKQIRTEKRMLDSEK